MEFTVGSFSVSKEDFLEKHGTPINRSRGWSFSNGKLPVVLTEQYRSSFAIVCHNKETFDSLTHSGDTRGKKIYLVPVRDLITVAGSKFIDFAVSKGWITNEEAEEGRKKEKENIEQLKAMIFSGDPSLFGGLSNEDVLVRACPKEFKENNPWSNYAMKLFFNGGDTSNWNWKTEDESIARKQFTALNAFLGSFGPKHEDKEAVAGWMLSEMLKEVPVYLKPKQK